MASPLFQLSLLLVLISGFASVLALEFTPGSACAAYCVDFDGADAYDPAASTTNSSDIVCEDLDFSTEDVGIKFKTCVECLETSKKTSDDESDLHWYLYNLRYTLSTCLFSSPKAASKDKIDSPCVIDTACLPLKGSMTEGDLKSDPEDTYGYCNSSAGSFSHTRIWPCVSCLQASADQAYLSNFMIALEAGCEQKPKPGTLISLSGTVFTKDAVKITEPVEDVRSKPEGAGSSTMTTGTIVGISVGAGLLLFGAIGLFCVYWRKQQKYNKSEKTDYFKPQSSTPDPFLPRDTQMSYSLRHYDVFQQPTFEASHSKGASVSSGEYYDQLEDDIRAGKLNYNFDPRAKNRGPNSAFPAHKAYIPRAVSRIAQAPDNSGDGRNPSPPPAVHRHTRSNTPDSYVLQTYLAASNDPVRYSTPPPPFPATRLPNPAELAPAPMPAALAQLPGPPPGPHPTQLPGPPPGAPPPREFKIPSLIFPSLSKLRKPKKYVPPTVNLQEATPIEDRGVRAMKISQPVMTSDSRFEDKPLAGGVVYAKDATVLQKHKRNDDNADIPMRSGKSTLYGM